MSTTNNVTAMRAEGDFPSRNTIIKAFQARREQNDVLSKSNLEKEKAATIKITVLFFLTIVAFGVGTIVSGIHLPNGSDNNTVAFVGCLAYTAIGSSAFYFLIYKDYKHTYMDPLQFDEYEEVFSHEDPASSYAQMKAELLAKTNCDSRV